MSFAKVLDQEFVIEADEVKSDWLDDILPGLVRLMQHTDYSFEFKNKLATYYSLLAP